MNLLHASCGLDIFCARDYLSQTVNLTSSACVIFTLLIYSHRWMCSDFWCTEKLVSFSHSCLRELKFYCRATVNTQPREALCYSNWKANLLIWNTGF